jgi:hypothetical protein
MLLQTLPQTTDLQAAAHTEVVRFSLPTDIALVSVYVQDQEGPPELAAAAAAAATTTSTITAAGATTTSTGGDAAAAPAAATLAVPGGATATPAPAPRHSPLYETVYLQDE